MRIFFIGTVEFSKNALRKLVNEEANIVGVATRSSSAFNTDFADLGELCRENEINYRYVTDINAEENIEWINSLAPDVIFCFGWSSLLKSEILRIPSLGVVGYHPTALPKNRGRHPLIWALVLGLGETASTFFFMDEGADSGDILSQEPMVISRNDDAGTLYRKMTKTALKQIEEFLPQLQNGTYTRIPQNDDEANTWRKRSKADGKIDFRMSSEAIYNLVRGLTHPYAGAHVTYRGEDIKVWSTELENSEYGDNIEPGKILETGDNSILVKTYDGAIVLTEHEFEQLPSAGEYL